jgi:hypothetical protein
MFWDLVEGEGVFCTFSLLSSFAFLSVLVLLMIGNRGYHMFIGSNCPRISPLISMTCSSQSSRERSSFGPLLGAERMLSAYRINLFRWTLYRPTTYLRLTPTVRRWDSTKGSGSHCIQIACAIVPAQASVVQRRRRPLIRGLPVKRSPHVLFDFPHYLSRAPFSATRPEFQTHVGWTMRLSFMPSSGPLWQPLLLSSYFSSRRLFGTHSHSNCLS